jgi:hypothetical protein
MKRLFAMICVLILVLSLVGCDLNTRNNLIGRWAGEQIELVFHRDGTVTVDDDMNNYTGELSWEVKDGKLIIDGKGYEISLIGQVLMKIKHEGYELNFRRISAT